MSFLSFSVVLNFLIYARKQFLMSLLMI